MKSTPANINVYLKIQIKEFGKKVKFKSHCNLKQLVLLKFFHTNVYLFKL